MLFGAFSKADFAIDFSKLWPAKRGRSGIRRKGRNLSVNRKPHNAEITTSGGVPGGIVGMGAKPR
jgi:hypothetical protein